MPTVEVRSPGSSPGVASGSAALVVRVLQSDAGEAAVNALVLIECPCLGGRTLEAFADAEGLVRFEGLPPGRYAVRAVWRDGQVGRAVTLEGRVQIDLRMASSASDQNVEARHPLLTGRSCPPGQACGLTEGVVEAGSGASPRFGPWPDLGLSPPEPAAGPLWIVYAGSPAEDPLARVGRQGRTGALGEGAGLGLSPAFGALHPDGVAAQGLALDLAGLGAMGGRGALLERPRASDDGVHGEFGLYGYGRLGAPRWPSTDEAVVALANRELAGASHLLVRAPLRRGSGLGLVVGLSGQAERLRSSERFVGREEPRSFPLNAASLGALVGLDWAIDARHELSLTAAGGPRWHAANYRLPLDWEPAPFGTNPGADPTSLVSRRLGDGPIDAHFGRDFAWGSLAGVRYRARLFDGALGLEAGLSHRASFAARGWRLDQAWTADSPRTQLQDGAGRDARVWLAGEGLGDGAGDESSWLPAETLARCSTAGCPLRRASRGGVGLRGEDRVDRVSARARAQHFFELYGSHRLEWGVDVDWLRWRSARRHSGSNADDFGGHSCDSGELGLGEACWSAADEGYSVRDSARVDNHRALLIDPGPGEPPNQRLSRGFGVRQFHAGVDAPITSAQGHGVRASSYAGTLSRTDYRVVVDERWSILPSLLLLAGGTWMISDLRDGHGLSEALVLRRQFAPRAGLVYDWTGRGDSRLYLGYRWELQPLPLHVAARAMAGVIEVGRWAPEVCLSNEDAAPPRDGRGHPSEWCQDSALYTAGADSVGTRPRLRGAHDRQLEAGYAQRVARSVDVQLRWVHRELGRTIVPVAADAGSDAVILANPGEGLGGVVGALPRARRRLDAWSVAIERRPESGLGVHAWGRYSFARFVGNDEGWIDPRTGARSLETTLRYERPELLINAAGPLAGVPPHRLDLGLGYAFGLGASASAGHLRVEGRYRWRAGIPVDARVDLDLPRYRGRNLVHALPRGAGGRTPGIGRFDLGVAYALSLPRGRARLELHARLLNVLATTAPLRVDEVYSFHAVRPIRGGTLSDLAHAKAALPGAGGRGVARELVTRNPNYGVATRFQQPLGGQLGLTLAF